MAESRWLLDEQGRILEAPVQQIALGGAAASGRTCAEVVRGRDDRGAPVCARCPVLARLRQGAYTAETRLLAGATALRCAATATPSGAEVRLTTDLTPDGSEVLASLARAVDRMRDRTRLFETLRCFLDVLRRAAGMEAAELFLVDPGHEALVLTLHQGRDVAAFQERAVFRVGEGFPGIVAYDGAPLCTHDLPGDERYLREAVKRLGYRTFLSYPLHAPGGFVGTLDLASRDADVSDAAVTALMTTVAPVLAAAVFGVLSEISERALVEVVEALQGGDARAAQRRVLRLAEELSGADRVDVVASADGASPDPPGRCPGIATCPVLRGEPHGVGVAGLRCPMGVDGPARYCLPWRQGASVTGVQQVVLAGAPDPPTQYLAPLLWLQHRAGHVLGMAGDEAGQGRSRPERVAIRALGPFQVLLQGRPMDPRSLGRRKAWLLFKLLVAHRGHVLARDELAERLWPGDDPGAAVKRVHVLVSTLRKAIELDAQRPTVILSEGDGYTLAPLEPVDIDVVAFERLLDEAERSENGAAIRRYAEAFQLYRGDFMAEELYIDWFELDRGYYRERLTSALERCAALQEASGRHGDAVVSLRRLLQADPWHRPAYDELARLLLQRGDVGQAARVRERGERLFSDDA